MTRLRIPFALLGSLVAILALAQTIPGRSLLRLSGLVPRPAAYSALYFTNPAALPTRVSGHFDLTVSFAVHNASQAMNSYQWVIQLVQGKKTQRAANGQMMISANGTVAEKSSVRALCRSGKLDVVVRLAAPAESIHFWVTCSA
jgi:hypothetical protein